MGIILLRTIIMYLLLIIAIRIMGKRQVGELEISELVITFMLSELAVVPIAEKNVPLTDAILPILALLLLEVIMSYFISKSSAFKKLIIGRPYVIINRGVVDQRGLQKLRMSPSELMSELRLKGISSLDEVEYAIVEDNGQMSVFKKERFSPATRDDIDIKCEEDGIAHTVMIDGKVFYDNLQICRKSEEWIYKTLKKKNIIPETVYLMTVDDRDNVVIILKE